MICPSPKDEGRYGRFQADIRVNMEKVMQWLRAELSATHCANSDIIDFVQSVANVEKMVM